jgi:hypothetical protein
LKDAMVFQIRANRKTQSNYMIVQVKKYFVAHFQNQVQLDLQIKLVLEVVL